MGSPGCGGGPAELPPLDDASREAIALFAERFFGALGDRNQEALNEAVYAGLPRPERAYFAEAIQDLVGLERYEIESIDRAAKGLADVGATVIDGRGRSRHVSVGLVLSKGQYYAVKVDVVAR